MNYYIIKHDYSKVGVPPIPNAVLAESYNPKNPMPDMAGYTWTKTKLSDRVYPEHLYLISKDKCYQFDYIRFWDGYIISKEFRSLLDATNTPTYTSVALTLINSRNEPISDKDYYYIDIPSEEALDVIDYEHSSFELDTDMMNIRGLSKSSVLKNKDFYGNIECYKRIALKEAAITRDIFTLKDITIHDLVCNERTRELIQNHLYGLDFIPLHEAERYYTYFR